MNLNNILTINEIRKKYLDFFVSKQHKLLPSFPLIPDRDKSLLLINSGMAPMKAYFSGAKIPPAPRVTTCQKCVRTPDLEIVGTTSRHATFFEMLGNFSFGDYFKQEAIEWAWEFVTKIIRLPMDKLYVSVFHDDDEAFEIWKKIISENKIFKLGKEDNFWEIGIGPCGPCSEIYYDRGIEKGCGKENCQPGCDCDRFIEIWNLVFTQFNRTENGEYELLAKKNIDTGMGLERLACVIQGVDSIFEVDTMQNILNAVSKIANIKYGIDIKSDISLRIICDHLRTAVFLISDEVTPSNEGRGYVLRCLIRRAARHGILLGIQTPEFLSILADHVIYEYQENYPELKLKAGFIKNVIKVEEQNFGQTIKRGLKLLEDEMNKLKSENEIIMSGEVAFRLYDTYGFPLDITREIAKDNQIEVDVEEFERHMKEQRNLARNARINNEDSGWHELNFGENKLMTEFIGYDLFECESKIIGIFCNQNMVNNITLEDNANDISIITSKTVFYPEGGGQIGDKGKICGVDFEFEVRGTQKISDNIIVHKGKLINGVLEINQLAKLIIDKKSRMSIAKNHTATHLLHKALEIILGSHVTQKGSHISAQRLRFDFPHIPEISNEELKSIEEAVNERIFESLDVGISEMSKKEAFNSDVTALFDDKYKERVRVVKIDDYSSVLCGGCHVKNTAQLGMFKIISLEKIAAGVRRIEAITGESAYDLLNTQYELINKASENLKCNKNEILKCINSIQNENTILKNKIGVLERGEVDNLITELLSNTVKLGKSELLFHQFENTENSYLAKIAESLQKKTDNTLCILISSSGESENGFVIVISGQKTINENKIYANEIFKSLTAEFGGKGGGKKEKAQGILNTNNSEKIKNFVIDLLRD